jgi:hypothetical protein
MAPLALILAAALAALVVLLVLLDLRRTRA